MVPLCTKYRRLCTPKFVQKSEAVLRDPPARRGPTRGGAGQRQRTPWAVPDQHNNTHIGE